MYTKKLLDMKKNYKHIDFLNKCAGSIGLFGDSIGEMTFSDTGLCGSARDSEIDNDLLDLFFPTKEDFKWLEWEEHACIYWGSGEASGKLGVLTPLRQTIVMFMAAMNNEL
jgi:hypothetical protein